MKKEIKYSLMGGGIGIILFFILSLSNMVGIEIIWRSLNPLLIFNEYLFSFFHCYAEACFVLSFLFDFVMFILYGLIIGYIVGVIKIKFKK